MNISWPGPLSSCFQTYTELKKKAYTFGFVEYSEGSGTEINPGGAQYLFCDQNSGTL